MYLNDLAAFVSDPAAATCPVARFTDSQMFYVQRVGYRFITLNFIVKRTVVPITRRVTRTRSTSTTRTDVRVVTLESDIVVKCFFSCRTYQSDRLRHDSSVWVNRQFGVRNWNQNENDVTDK